MANPRWSFFSYAATSDNSSRTCATLSSQPLSQTTCVTWQRSSSVRTVRLVVSKSTSAVVPTGSQVLEPVALASVEYAPGELERDLLLAFGAQVAEGVDLGRPDHARDLGLGR